MEITLATAGIIALITALVQLGKGVGLKDAYAPFAALGLGVLYFVATAGFDVVPIVSGLATGLTAMGLYSVGGKKIYKTLGGK